MRALLSTCLLVVLTGAANLEAKDELPWVFNAPRGEGYSIDLVSVEPAPATPLIAGSKVDFKVTVKYSLTVAKQGAVILVFQDDRNRSAKTDGQQVVQPAAGPGGTLTLSDSITIPRGASELRLFVPLVPDGISTTTGEITIRWPISKK